MESSISTTEHKTTDHCHSPEEIVAVRSSLSAFVPTELADLILDEAKCWSKAGLSFKSEPCLILDSENDGDNATFCCTLTPKLCDLLDSGMPVDGVIKMKSVCFKIASYGDLPTRAWHHSGERNYSGMI
jgi:hypothetical protein